MKNYNYFTMQVKNLCLFFTLSTSHATIVVISHLVKKVPLQELLSATEFSMRLV